MTPRIELMWSGPSWNHWFLRPNLVDVQPSSPAGMLSTPSAMWCGLAGLDGLCLMTFRPGKWSTTASGFGGGRKPGNNFTKPSTAGSAG
jgi:hypothetical protein